MNEYEGLNLLRKKGFIFDSAKGFITDKNRASVVRDAATMITAPNSGIPTVFTAYIDPRAIDILTAPTRAREIFSEVRKGDWTTSVSIFKAVEMTGHTTPYTDYGNGATADVNVTFPQRENYMFQTHIRYGEREIAVSAEALVNLATEKQRSATTIIDKDANKYYLYGVEGHEIYGLLNEPNLPASITPSVVGDNKTHWADKTTQQIYDDILALASTLFTNSMGNIDEKANLVLAVSPAMSVLLGKATDYNVSVKDMLNKYFDNLDFVTLPELATENGDSVYLIAREIMGSKTAELGFSEKLRQHRVVPYTSWYEQKYTSGTYGCIVYRPMGIASMTGVA